MNMNSMFPFNLGPNEILIDYLNGDYILRV